MIRRAIVCLIVATVTASCGPDKPPENKPAPLVVPTTVVPVGAPVAANNAGAPANSSEMPIPPADAQYTIYCQSIMGPDHYERSRAVRQALQNGTPMKDWYLIHGNDVSMLYYGFYKTVDRRDPVNGKDGERAKKDLDTIRAMRDSEGGRPFSASLWVPLSAPDPASNPAWDLSRTDGYWSVEIAAYTRSAKDGTDRKQCAVDAVRAARAEGIEAYYYHGDTVSSVCIGCWPQAAAREIDIKEQNVNPDAPLVVTARPMAPDVAKQFTDRGINTAAPQVDPVDPTLVEVLRRYPEHAVDDMVYPKKPVHSFLVRVPHRDAMDNVPSTPAEPPPPGMTQTPSQEPGLGHLKSLGE